MTLTHSPRNHNNKFLDLPEEATYLIAQYLPAPDVLQLLSTHPQLRDALSHSRPFWVRLLEVQYPDMCSTFLSKRNRSKNAAGSCNSAGDWKEMKDRYILRASCNAVQTVQWHPATTTVERIHALDRHVCCQVGDHIVLTGGCTYDNTIYIKNVHTTDDPTWSCANLSTTSSSSTDVNWVYGATLTQLDNTRAIRFGGFRPDLGNGETDHVAILHLVPAPSADGDNVVAARWETIVCQYCTINGSSIHPQEEESWTQMTARVHHTATLLRDRYLVVMGGMQRHRSILSPMILDCHTWTWYGGDGITTTSLEGWSPSLRHGCSVIADGYLRDRLVLFGGGKGNDAFASERTDFTDVWALNLNGFGRAVASSSTEASPEDNTSLHQLRKSLPWKWELLLDNLNNEEVKLKPTTNAVNLLNPVERLNLGRYHAGHRVGRDIVLLLMGSKRPATNSLLGYNLAKDEFFRPRVPSGSYIPRARSGFASVFVESLGCIVVHGGRTTQGDHMGLSDTLILDVIPALRRLQGANFLWPVDTQVAASPAVTEEYVTDYQSTRGFRSAPGAVMDP